MPIDPLRKIRSSVAYRALCLAVKREEHTCWLCLKPIDVSIPYRDPVTRRVNPESWSLDHMVPISQHPELALVREHARAAHFGCNSARGNRTPRRPNPAPVRTSRDWAPSAPSTTTRRVILVTGPPCAGKTHYAQRNAQPDDTILDADVIGQAAMTRHLATINSTHGTTWVIRCAPGPTTRAALAAQLNAELIHLQPPFEVLHERAKHRPNPRQAIAAINAWHKRDLTDVPPPTTTPPRTHRGPVISQPTRTPPTEKPITTSRRW